MAFPTVELSREDLASRLGAAKPSEAAEGGPVEHVLEAARELLEDTCRVTFRPIPEHVAEELLVRTARALWDARRMTHGGGQLTTTDGEQGPRAPRDPLAGSSSLLARYVVPM